MKRWCWLVALIAATSPMVVGCSGAGGSDSPDAMIDVVTDLVLPPVDVPVSTDSPAEAGVSDVAGDPGVVLVDSISDTSSDLPGVVDVVFDAPFDAPDDAASDAVETVIPPSPTRYPEGRIHSPITPFVKDHLLGILNADDALQDDVFMKVGDSITVDNRFLKCLASPMTLPDVDQDAAAQFFRGGDAAGTTPFDRVSLAALGGRTASWAVTGSPSPIAQEVDAISPRFAVIMFGTNDIGWYPDNIGSMLRWYGDAMIRLVDGLLPQGIVPVLSSIPQRGDDAVLDLWVPTINAIVRGLAETRQVPFVDYHLALEPLPNHGLGSDGVHPNGATAGACDFTTAGLQYGQNMRNLTTVEVLTRLHQTLILDEPAPDVGGRVLEGTGTVTDPIRVDALPFSDWQDTANGTSRAFDAYPCGTGQDESGPEFVYRLELTDTQRLRMMILDVGNVDIDLYLLDESGQPAGCLARNDTVLAGTLTPGVYHVVADTYVSGGVEHVGGYLLVILSCESGDAACDALLY